MGVLRSCSALAVGLFLATGCSLERAPLVVSDAGSPELDGGVRHGDAGPDAHVPPPDSGPPDTGVPCVPGAELCNGVDDDCDSSTPDGADDPMLDMPCDGDDRDACKEATYVCAGGALVCPADGDEATDALDLCNGMDENCNGGADDGADDPEVGAPCDGDDSDRCAEGVTTCEAGAIACNDETGSTTETCNGADDDCNGRIDDGAGAGCPCHWHDHDGHAYLFCDGGDAHSWAGARDFCRADGYELVTIDDAAEQQWVRDTADTTHNGADWWTGASDRDEYGGEGNFEWVADGSALTYTNWNTDEPNDFDSSEDCVELNTDLTSDSGAQGGWNDEACTDSQRFVCEAAP